jgi:tRNA(Phe) wybutosine-synthesizing methylase Tyw3
MLRCFRSHSNAVTTSKSSGSASTIRINTGGRTKGSTVASKTAMKERRDEVITECEILYNEKVKRLELLCLMELYREF